MKKQLRDAYEKELHLADAAESVAQLDDAFRHLERAHILSQRFSFAHTYVHLRMLRVGFRRRDGREIFGQITRSIAALTKSRIWVPVGNTGGSDVNPLKPMPVPSDLQRYLD